MVREREDENRAKSLKIDTENTCKKLLIPGTRYGELQLPSSCPAGY